MTYFRGNSKGQSLVSVLISVAMMGIVVVGMASMFNYQNREARALSEKLGSTDLEKTLIASLADGSVCRYVLNTPNPLTFDSTAVSPSNPQTITLTSPLYASVTPGEPPTPGPVIAKVGVAASSYSSTLIVKAIKLQITDGSGSSFTGNWLVEFDSTKTVRPLRPVSVSTTLKVNTESPNSPTSAAIASCQSGGDSGRGLGGMEVFTSTADWTVPAGITKVKVTAIGAGGAAGGFKMTCRGSCTYAPNPGGPGSDSFLEGCDVRGNGGGGSNQSGINGPEGTAVGTIAIPGSGGRPGQATPYAGTAGYAGLFTANPEWHGGGGGTGIGICKVSPGSVLKVTVGTGGTGAQDSGPIIGNQPVARGGPPGQPGWVMLEY